MGEKPSPTRQQERESEERTAELVRKSKAARDEKIDEKKRTFLKKAGLLLLGGALGMEGVEKIAEHNLEEKELDLIARALANQTWAEGANRAAEINRERELRRKSGGGGARHPRTGTSVASGPRERSEGVREFIQTDVEKMMSMPGSTLANESRALAVTAGDSQLLRRMLNLPDDATSEQVSNTMDAFFQMNMETAVAEVNKRTFRGKRPGTQEFKERADKKFALFLRYQSEVQEAVVKYSTLYGVSARRIYGLIGAEGSEELDTVSHKDAYGFLQVRMPAAEDAVVYSRAHSGNLKVDQPKDLFNLDTNIHAAVAYFAKMRDDLRQDGLAVLAYNGGAGRVRQGVAGLEEVFPANLADIRAGGDTRKWQSTGINLVSLREAGKRLNIGAINNNLNEQFGYAYQVEYYGNLLHEVYKTKEK